MQFTRSQRTQLRFLERYQYHGGMPFRNTGIAILPARTCNFVLSNGIAVTCRSENTGIAIPAAIRAHTLRFVEW